MAFYEYGLLKQAEIASLEEAGAVGNVLCHFIDAEGHIVPHPVNERVLAVNPMDLQATRNVVLVSGGWRKLTVIRAALKLLRPAALIVNDVPTWRADRMPYGGVKDSGLGREGPAYAMDELTEPRLLVFKS